MPGAFPDLILRIITTPIIPRRRLGPAVSARSRRSKATYTFETRVKEQMASPTAARLRLHGQREPPSARALRSRFPGRAPDPHDPRGSPRATSRVMWVTGRSSGGGTGAVVARTWLSIRVDLVEGHGERYWPRPGRILAASRSHTFAQLGQATDDASGAHGGRLLAPTTACWTSPELRPPVMGQSVREGGRADEGGGLENPLSKLCATKPPSPTSRLRSRLIDPMASNP
jgi:hypothetical protein